MVMSLKQQYTLNFSSDEESESCGPTLKINIPSQIGISDSQHHGNDIYQRSNIITPQLSESGFLRPNSSYISNIGTEGSGLNRKRVHPKKRLRFISPHVENIDIPQPIALTSQAGAFEFPAMGSTQDCDSPPHLLPESPPYDYTANTTFFTLGNRTTFSLFQQERSPEEQAKINRKVVSFIDKLIQEIQVIRRKRDRHLKLTKIFDVENKASAKEPSELYNEL